MKKFYSVIGFIICFSIFFASNAQPDTIYPNTIYDDFSGEYIDTGLWNYNNAHPERNILYQSDGFLQVRSPSDGPFYYSGAYDRLTSTYALSGDFEVILKYEDFYFNGAYNGDTPELVLETSWDGGEIMIQRYFSGEYYSPDSGGNFMSYGYGDPSWSYGTWPSYSASSDSGLLSITRIGSTMATFFNEGSDWICTSYIPDAFMGEVFFGISVYNGDRGEFRTKVDNIQIVNPVPEPGIIILLGSGLLGLFVISRKKIMENDGAMARLFPPHS